MLSYRLQCLISKNLGSGDNRILVSSGLRAVVGMMPIASGRTLVDGGPISGGFSRRTSSRSN